MRVGNGEQTVRETKRNADAFKIPTLLDSSATYGGAKQSYGKWLDVSVGLYIVHRSAQRKPN